MSPLYFARKPHFWVPTIKVRPPDSTLCLVTVDSLRCVKKWRYSILLETKKTVATLIRGRSPCWRPAAGKREKFENNELRHKNTTLVRGPRRQSRAWFRELHYLVSAVGRLKCLWYRSCDNVTECYSSVRTRSQDRYSDIPHIPHNLLNFLVLFLFSVSGPFISESSAYISVQWVSLTSNKVHSTVSWRLGLIFN